MKRQHSAPEPKAGTAALLRLVAALGGKRPGAAALARLSVISAAREHREATTNLLADSGLVVAIDWRSPPDEVLVDLRPAVPAKYRRAVLQPLSDDLSAEKALEVIAGRLERAGGPHLAHIDQASDTYVVLCVPAGQTTLPQTVEEAGLGRLKSFSPRAEPQPKPGRSRPARRPVSLERGPTTATHPKSWKDVRAAASCFNDHAVLLAFARDEEARAMISEHLHLAPKTVAPVLGLLATLLRQGEPTGALDDQIEAIRYYSFAPGAAPRTLELLAERAGQVRSVRELRRFLLAGRFPTEAAGLETAARKLPADQRATVLSVVGRGVRSKDFEVLSAALHCCVQLGLIELRPQLNALTKSADSETSRIARQAVRRLKRVLPKGGRTKHA